MLKKRSLILELFLVLFVILVALVSGLGLMINKYAERVILDEVIQLNANVLQQVTIGMRQEMEDVENLASRIAYDKDIIGILKRHDGTWSADRAEELHIEGIMAEYIWSYRNASMLIDAHLIDRKDRIYSSSYSMSSGQKEDFDRYPAPLYDSGPATFPVRFYDASGKNEYYYQLVRYVQDYISRESYGMLLLNVNEKLLWNHYIRLNNEEKDFYVVDNSGIILSHADKARIGSPLTGFRTALDAGDISRHYIQEGKLWLYTGINDYGWYLVESITLQSAMAPLRSIQTMLVGLGALVVALMALSLRITANKISEPMSVLDRKIQEFSDGEMSVQIPDSPYREFSQLSVSLNELIHQVNYLLEEHINSERQKRLLELNFLQAQINPHFIYNTLSSIRFYVEMGKNREAEDMLFHFSKILRRVLTRTEDFVRLKDEVHLAENYVALQKRRYHNRLEFVNRISEELMDLEIPSFILQPIVENAIFYGVEEDDPVHIELDARVENDDLLVTISDNGPGISSGRAEEIFQAGSRTDSVGIVNVDERIRLLYGPDCGLQILKNEPKGTRIVLKLRRYI